MASGKEQWLAGLVHRPGARVTVELSWDALSPGVEVRILPLPGRLRPTPMALAAWEQGVVAGVRYALGVARALPCAVRVTELAGDVGITTPTVMGAAAATAVWEALEFEPAREVRDQVGRWVEESRERGPLWLADFAVDRSESAP